MADRLSYRMMVESTLVVFFFVVLMWIVVISFHLGCLAIVRRRWAKNSSRLASPMLIGLTGIGAWGLWRLMEDYGGTGEVIRFLLFSLKVAAVFLYLGGCLVYIEFRSLLSRGYSLRILVDLLNKGGNASLETLKVGYGGGMGIRGILDKRLQTLSRLRLVRFHGNQIGPLTLLGRIFAATGSGIRQLLCLKSVG